MASVDKSGLTPKVITIQKAFDHVKEKMGGELAQANVTDESLKTFLTNLALTDYTRWSAVV